MRPVRENRRSNFSGTIRSKKKKGDERDVTHEEPGGLKVENDSLKKPARST
jgi:hypothetical protein